VLALFSGILITGLMLLTTVDVIKRKVAGSGVGGAVEYTEVLLVLTVFAGMAAAEVNNAHIRVSVLVERLSPIRAAAFRSVGGVAVTLLLVWATVKTAGAAQRSFEIREFTYGLAAVPIWPAKLMVLIGLGALTLALAYRSFDGFRTLQRELVRHRQSGSVDGEVR
jgi:TRAP-type C4-dicarboxylate transport system permease small subunit